MSIDVEDGGARSPKGATVRADLEGLRAVAVLLVLAYHFFPDAVPGGYVGVDVFFVISGYLITHSLMRARGQGGSTRAWLLGFWARRVRRLLPNALLVLLVTGVVGAGVYSQFALKRLGSDIAASALASVNWLFVLRSIDYLAWDETQRSTLLHYWSLAVEEQFYLAWPLVLLAVMRPRAPRARLALVAMLGAVSFVVCVWLAHRSLTHAFFSTPARAWELLAGASLALRGSVPGLNRFAGLGGLVLIAAAALLFGDDTRHPGWPTLMPVLGAFLVVAPGRSPAPASTLLAQPWLQYLGSRSYAIYLWHWPILVLGDGVFQVRSLGGKALLVALSFLAAEAAYRCVEHPARFRWARGWRAGRVVAAGVLAAGAVAAFGWLLRAHGATDVREALGLRPQTRAQAGLPPLDRVRDDLPQLYRNGCHLGVDAEASPPCLGGDPGAARVAVLFGDSHAAQWYSALDAVTAAQAFGLHAWTKSSCPSADVTIWNAGTRNVYRACDRWREATLARIEALRPGVVILANLVEPSPAVVQPGDDRPVRGREALDLWARGLERTIARIQATGAHVVVIRDTPRPRPDLLDCLYAAPSPSHCELGRAEALAVPAVDVLAAQRGDATVWDFTEALCPGSRCPVFQPQTRHVVYRDRDHLSDSEVRRLTPEVAARWQGLPEPVRGALR